MGLNEANGNIYNNLEEAFKPEYVGQIGKYYQGTITLGALNVSLTELL